MSKDLLWLLTGGFLVLAAVAFFFWRYSAPRKPEDESMRRHLEEQEQRKSEQ